MISINEDQFGYKAIKRSEIENVKKGYKRLAKKNFDKLVLGYDIFENRMILVLDGHVLPRQIKRKSKGEKVTDITSRYAFKEKGVGQC